MKATFMRTARILGPLVFFITSTPFSKAQCRKAPIEDVPHGANEFILFAEQEVAQIHGKAFIPSDLPKDYQAAAKDVVVEVYVYDGKEDYDDVSKTLREKKRVAACITGPDGNFSFPRLKRGRYLLRVGTRKFADFNVTFAIVSLNPGLKRQAGRGIEIKLRLGTQSGAPLR